MIPSVSKTGSVPVEREGSQGFWGPGLAARYQSAKSTLGVATTGAGDTEVGYTLSPEPQGECQEPLLLDVHAWPAAGLPVMSTLASGLVCPIEFWGLVIESRPWMFSLAVGPSIWVLFDMQASPA